MGGKIIVNIDTYYETRQWLRLAKRFEIVEVDFSKFTIFNSLSEEKEINGLIQGAVAFYLDNPSFFMKHYDLKEISYFAQKVGAKLIVDNTILSVYYTNPIKHGADFAVESYGKYVGGHGDIMAGAIICRKEPVEDMPVFIGRRGRCVNAMTVFLLERSLETLNVRMKRHTETGRFIDKKLSDMGIKHWYSGYGGCIILPGFGEFNCSSGFLQFYGVFQKIPTFGTTFSGCSFVRSDELYSVGSYVRISCGLENKDLIWDSLKKALETF